ncbi:elongation factor P [Candidatus Aerophobetes bacterium]|uniref:Elongation factor P n=1 Tax=Aerophobetes bacterium TaxID=2030807 RepID=A0A2A4X279_UNCAE|nr:MAG: elongation factor P [Candidatus Aerophobetes bacterium]
MTTTTSSQLVPGQVISEKGKTYRVESSIKVSMPRGVPFMKTELKDLVGGKLIEKSFQLDQEIEVLSLAQRHLEFLYLEDKQYLFLDVDELDQVLVNMKVVGDKINFLKEGIQVKAEFYGSTVFSIELPQFLELMVVKIEEIESKVSISNVSKLAVIETGGRVEVPLFIEVGDIIKVDTHLNEYVQRI